MKSISIPPNALVLLVGPAGSGKSTFAGRNFRPSEIVSSDRCREMVSDNMEDMACSSLAFDLFHHWIDKRLQLGRLTVADATSLTGTARGKLKEIAERRGAPVVLFALESPLELCLQQNRERTRYVPQHVIEQHFERMRAVAPFLEREGYHAVHWIAPRTDPIQIRVVANDTDAVAPGFDVIGDIHGCYDELIDLVRALGYLYDLEAAQKLSHPEGRRLVFTGDFTDRGPKNVEVLRFVQSALIDGHLAVQGNHDNKLMRWLKGNKVKVAHGLQRTVDQLTEYTSEEERIAFRDMLAALPYYLVLSVPGHPDLVVCHAGMPRTMVGRPQTGAVKSHCLYGEVSGEVDDDGFPIRGNTFADTWIDEMYAPILVHGHIVVPDPLPQLEVNVVNVDQGCVFGGQLTGFHYPECVFEHVPAYEDHAGRWETTRAPMPHILTTVED